MTGNFGAATGFGESDATANTRAFLLGAVEETAAESFAMAVPDGITTLTGTSGTETVEVDGTAELIYLPETNGFFTGAASVDDVTWSGTIRYKDTDGDIVDTAPGSVAWSAAEPLIVELEQVTTPPVVDGGVVVGTTGSLGFGRVGIYSSGNSPGSDTVCHDKTGRYPEVANDYYQVASVGNIVTNQSPRLARGTAVHLNLSLKGLFGDGTDNSNRGLAAIANGPSDPDYAAVVAVIDTYIARLATLSAAYPNVPVIAALEGEVDAKVNKYLTGATGDKIAATAVQAGQAINYFLGRVKTEAPLVYGALWFAGTQKTLIRTVMDQITAGNARFLLGDPYSNGTGIETMLACFLGWTNWVRAEPNYTRLGSPPLGIGECGMQTGSGAHTDAEVATYIYPDRLTSGPYTMRQTMAAAGVVTAAWFDSARDKGHVITDTAHPLSTAAFGASLAAPRIAVGGPVSPPPPVVTPTAPSGPTPSSDWTLQYATAFPALTGWTVYDGQTQNNDNSVNLAKNVVASSTGLTITGKKESGYAKPYTSGEIVGKSTGQVVGNYFRAEVSGTFEDIQGVWPALLWFRPNNGTDGEIDVMEWMGGLWTGDQRRVAITMHNAYTTGVHDPAKSPLILADNPWFVPGAVHTYTIEKTPGQVQVWVDGHLAATFTAASKTWWNSIMEVTGRTWYPRITLQIGAGAVTKTVPNPAAGFTSTKMTLSSLKLWAYNPAADTLPDPIGDGVPDATDPETVDFTWSFVPTSDPTDETAQHQLLIESDDPTLTDAPGAVIVNVANGVEHEEITYTLAGGGVAETLGTGDLNESGVSQRSLPIPLIPKGVYALTATGDLSGSATLTMTVLNDPLDSTPDDEDLDPLEPPTDNPVGRWAFYDRYDSEVSYVLPRNPVSWTSPERPNWFAHDSSTAPNGTLIAWQAARRAWRMEFSGVIFTQEEYDDLLFWADRRRRFWLIDHRNRTWVVTFEQFDARARNVPNKPWIHDYTMKVVVFRQAR